jgi:hypothetical protein
MTGYAEAIHMDDFSAGGLFQTGRQSDNKPLDNACIGLNALVHLRLVRREIPRPLTHVCDLTPPSTSPEF